MSGGVRAGAGDRPGYSIVPETPETAGVLSRSATAIVDRPKTMEKRRDGEGKK